MNQNALSLLYLIFVLLNVLIFYYICYIYFITSPFYQKLNDLLSQCKDIMIMVSINRCIIPQPDIYYDIFCIKQY